MLALACLLLLQHPWSSGFCGFSFVAQGCLIHIQVLTQEGERGAKVLLKLV